MEDEGRIVPQLKIGADGSIQLDEARYMLLYCLSYFIPRYKYITTTI